MSSESEMLEELARRAADESPALEGEHISASDTHAQQDELLKNATARLNEIITMTVQACFLRYAPYWLSEDLPEELRIKKPQLELLGQSYVAVIAEYLPWLLENFPAIAGAVLCTALVVGPNIAAGIPRFKPETKISPKNNEEAAD